MANAVIGCNEFTIKNNSHFSYWHYIQEPMQHHCFIADRLNVSQMFSSTRFSQFRSFNYLSISNIDCFFKRLFHRINTGLARCIYRVCEYFQTAKHPLSVWFPMWIFFRITLKGTFTFVSFFISTIPEMWITFH